MVLDVCGAELCAGTVLLCCWLLGQVLCEGEAAGISLWASCASGLTAGVGVGDLYGADLDGDGRRSDCASRLQLVVMAIGLLCERASCAEMAVWALGAWSRAWWAGRLELRRDGVAGRASRPPCWSSVGLVRKDSLDGRLVHGRAFPSFVALLHNEGEGRAGRTRRDGSTVWASSSCLASWSSCVVAVWCMLGLGVGEVAMGLVLLSVAIQGSCRVRALCRTGLWSPGAFVELCLFVFGEALGVVCRGLMTALRVSAHQQRSMSRGL